METNNSVDLTSTELSHLWNNYLSDSMAMGVLSFFLEKTQDKDIMPILELALSISKSHVEEIQKIFNQEQYAVPYGFNEKDVNLKAPALFFDSFYLHYIKQMSRVAMNAYSLGLSLAVRNDIRKFYNDALNQSMELDEQVTNVLLNKGMYIRSPYIVGDKEINFVKETIFLDGVIGEHRPLLGMEIAHIYGNIQTCALANVLCMGFSQAASSKEVTKFIIKSRDKMSKHIEAFGNKLNESHLKIPMTWNDTVTTSTTSPFSDKLILFHINAVLATSLADYGIALGASMRRDLGAMYASKITDLGLHLEDGAKIMIKNDWMEKPPQASNRDELASKPKEQ